MRHRRNRSLWDATTTRNDRPATALTMENETSVHEVEPSSWVSALRIACVYFPAVQLHEAQKHVDGLRSSFMQLQNT